jgi:hypothetical protein
MLKLKFCAFYFCILIIIVIITFTYSHNIYAIGENNRANEHSRSAYGNQFADKYNKYPQNNYHLFSDTDYNNLYKPFKNERFFLNDIDIKSHKNRNNLQGLDKEDPKDKITIVCNSIQPYKNLNKNGCIVIYG